MAEVRLTKNSVIDVPQATIVRPITIWGIIMRWARATAPSVIRSAPRNTRKMPNTIRPMLSAKSILLYSILIL